MSTITTRQRLVTARGTGATVIFLSVCALGLIPWTVGLAVTLPTHYAVGSWTLTWTGFDIALVAGFAVTAWALRTQRPIALPAAVFTCTLLLCDGWFDVLTAHSGHDLLVSAAFALFGEIPAAIVLTAISTKLLRANAVATEGHVASLSRVSAAGSDQLHRTALRLARIS
jgi:hypothetical protein